MSKLIRIPLDQIKINPQVRKEFNEEELRLLGESLKVRQLQPIVVRPYLPPEWILVAGERRVRAARLVGMIDLLAMPIDGVLDDTEIQILQLTENVHRAELTAAEKTDACIELMKLNPSWSGADLAAVLKVDPSYITRLLSTVKLIPPAQEAYRKGKIVLGSAYELTKESPERQEKLLASLLNGATRSQIIRERKQQKSRKPRASSPKAVMAMLEMGGGAVVTVKGIDLTVIQVAELLRIAAQHATDASNRGITLDEFNQGK